MLFIKCKRKLAGFFQQVLNFVLMKIYKVVCGSKCVFRGVVWWEGRNSITLGDNVRINSGKHYNMIGGACRTIMRTVGHGKISIGDNCGISNSALVSSDSIVIEKNVLIGGNCKIYDTDFHPIHYLDRINNNYEKIKFAPIRICSGAFIGAHCIILKGVTIGSNSIVGAGSVVAKDIPDNQIWAGNPAKFIRSL